MDEANPEFGPRGPEKSCHAGRRVGIVLVLLALAGVVGWAVLLRNEVAELRDLHATEHVANVLQQSPSVVGSAAPDRVLLTCAGDMASSRAVTWRTSNQVEHGFAEIAVDASGTEFVDRARRVEAISRPFKCDLGAHVMHRAEFTGLQPATRYVYRVGTDEDWSEWFSFRMPAATPEPFSFVVLGDVQNNILTLASRVIREAYATAPRAAFTLYMGDIVNKAESDFDWGNWYAATSWINATVPMFSTAGNHEYSTIRGENGAKMRRRTPHWDAQFAFPQNGPDGVKNTVYCFNYQNLRVIVLNSNEQLETQTPWLHKLLTDNPQTWTVVTFHHPILPFARGKVPPGVSDIWRSTIEQAHVDLVLCGHDHVYARRLAADAQTPPGTMHIISVSGSKSYEMAASSRAEARRVAVKTQMFQVICIDGGTLRYEARTATGELYDVFTLRKHAGAPTELIEQVPPTPERMKPSTGTAATGEDAEP